MLNHGYEATTVKNGDGPSRHHLNIRITSPTETEIMSMPAMTEITIVTDMKNTPIPAITDGTGYYIYLIKADFMAIDDVY